MERTSRIDNSATAPAAQALTQIQGLARGFARQSVMPWLALLALYLALDYLGQEAVAQASAGPRWNLGLGLCLAVVTRRGWAALPIAFLGPVMSDIVLRNANLTPFYSFWIGALTTAETAGALFFGRVVAAAAKNGVLANRWVSIVLIAIPLSLGAAVLHSASLFLGSQVTSQALWDVTARLWIADLTGILVVAPAALMLPGVRPRAVARMWTWEVGAQALFGAGLLWFVFVFNGHNVREYFYILSVPLIWICLRHGSRGAAVVNIVLLVMLTIFLAWFDQGDAQAAQLPTRMLVLVATALALGVTVDESRNAADWLRNREQALSSNLKAGETSELAGTLAHELSHPLGAISNYAAVIKHILDRQPTVEPELMDVVARLRHEVRRATETIQRLREFFRSGSLRLERIDIGQTVKDSVTVLANKFEAAGISVRVVASPGPSYVSADAIQLHSVIHNLLVNAIDELRGIGSNEKIVSISVQRDEDDVRLTIEDSGSGVAPDIADHIFEPMATTKKDGLGLGLSMSKSIIQAHGGRIAVDRSPYGGARFTVVLPRGKM